jgi:adenylylsulfate kinase
LAKAFTSALKERWFHIKHLDGDEVRRGMCYGLGFSPDGRHENLRRIAHMCKMFNEADVMVSASFIAPLSDMRAMMRDIIGDNMRIVHVQASEHACEERDVKGMWARARRGEIIGFTGYDADYDVPKNADLVLDTEKLSVEECVAELMATFIDS